MDDRQIKQVLDFAKTIKGSTVHSSVLSELEFIKESKQKAMNYEWLYHCTDAMSFKNILKSREFWLTNLRFVNDKNEVERIDAKDYKNAFYVSSFTYDFNIGADHWKEYGTLKKGVLIAVKQSWFEHKARFVLPSGEYLEDYFFTIHPSFDDALKEKIKLQEEKKIVFNPFYLASFGFYQVIYDDELVKKIYEDSIITNSSGILYGKSVMPEVAGVIKNRSGICQRRAAATFNSRYTTQKGVESLRFFWNSDDNFEIMQQVANQAKSDVRVCEVTENGTKEIRYLTSKEMTFMAQLARYDGHDIEIKDITYRATPEQMTDAVIAKLEEVNKEREESSQKKIKALQNKGYLDEDGKVPKSVRLKMISKYQQSMNAQSIQTLKGTDYKAVSNDAAVLTKSSIGKIIAGQMIYYAAPPIIYELRTILEDNDILLDNALERFGNAAQRIGRYVASKFGMIFTNITQNRD